MGEWRPSPALRRLRSQRDKARNQWLHYCASYTMETKPGYWRKYFKVRAMRWWGAYQVLAELAWEQEVKERRG